VFDHPNLRVMTTPTEHLLAMKVRAAGDADDVLLLLLYHLDLRDVATVEAIVARYFPDEQLSERSRLLLEDLLTDATEP
jgi:hypothetical protein